MDWLNVLDRIQAGEDEHTELGRDHSFSEKNWQKSACAFAGSVIDLDALRNHGVMIQLQGYRDSVIYSLPTYL
ncbi:hypothetical protein [Halochromatium roseum]|uniref:hypothetical protein n=1 Tax=Halochromatium roseum TaxID=391920 RepID=UPI0019115FF8|nr:hypothetical protein [Halochromatium roseum]MBK5940284.1 hypothetical protein [Halochromatium roseum]